GLNRRCCYLRWSVPRSEVPRYTRHRRRGESLAARFRRFSPGLIVLCDVRFSLYIVQVVGRLLIYEIVQPIREKQVGMSPPVDDRIVIGIVVGIVISGKGNVEAFRQIT